MRHFKIILVLFCVLLCNSVYSAQQSNTSTDFAFLDRFIRADSTTVGTADTGQIWLEASNLNWQISSNKLFCPNSGVVDKVYFSVAGNVTPIHTYYTEFMLKSVSATTYIIKHSSEGEVYDATNIYVNAGTHALQYYIDAGVFPCGTTPTLTASTHYKLYITVNETNRFIINMNLTDMADTLITSCSQIPYINGGTSAVVRIQYRHGSDDDEMTYYRTAVWNGTMDDMPLYAEADNTLPTYFNYTINNTAPRYNDKVYIKASLSDETGAGQYYFSFQNNSNINSYDNTTCAGTWSNNQIVSCEKAITTFGYRKNEIINARLFFNDSSGNWNSTGNITFMIADTPTTTPTLTSPVQNDHNNINFSIAVDCSDADGDAIYYEIYVDEDSTAPTTLKQNTTSNSYITSLITDGNYSTRARCLAGGVTTSYSPTTHFVLDTVSPAYQYINAIEESYSGLNNESVLDNDTVLSQDANSFDIEWLVTDYNNLDSSQLTCTNKSDMTGEVFYNQTFSAIGSTSYTNNINIDINNLAYGSYLYCEARTSDVHTKKKLTENELDYSVDLVDKKMVFDSENKNNIYLKLESVDDDLMFSDFVVDKKDDRYEFGIKFDKKSEKESYVTVIRLSSDMPIHYLPDSEYQGHFISYNGNGLNGNWIDFENIGEVVAIEKEDDHNYLITISHDDLTIMSHSIGGLNVRQENFKILYNTKPVFDFDLVDREVDAGQNFYYDINCSDPNSDTISYSDNTTLFSIDSSTGEISDIPSEDASSVYNILITCDDGVDSVSQDFIYIVNDAIAPRWSDPATNFTTAHHNLNGLFSVDWLDGKGLLGYVFSTNDTGPWIESALQTLTGTADTAAYEYKITAAKHTNVGWRMKANDTSANQNITNIFSFTIANSVPTHSTPVLNSSEGTNYRDEDLACYAQNVDDIDGDDATLVYSWYKNSDKFMALLLPFDVDGDDCSGNNNDGIVTGAAYVDGKHGKALSFDGNDFVSINDDDTLDFIDKMSWELWLKRDGTGEEALLDKTNASNISNYRLKIRNDDKLELLYSVIGAEAGNYSEIWDSAAGFANGTYANAKYDTDHIELLPANTSGNYISAVFDSQAAGAQWNTLSWTEALPYQEELPDNKGADVGADMAGNVLLLHLDEAAGSIADSSGEGNNGTYNGALYSQDGKFDKAVGFDGVNDYVDCVKTNSLNITSKTITVEAWVYFKSLPSSGNVYGLVTKHDGANNGYFFQIYNDGTNYKTYFVINNINNINNYAFQPNKWYHIVGVYDSNVQKTFINGNKLAVETSNTANILNSNTNLFVGKRYDGRYLNGTVDETAVYNRDLSDDEVLKHYKRGALRLNLTVRSCDDNACAGEDWQQTSTSSPADLDVGDNRYFQYNALFSTEDVSYSPELYNATLDYYKTGAVDGHSSLISTATIIDTNWHHVAVTFDDTISTDNFKMYIDNSLDAAKTEHNITHDGDSNLLVGKDRNGHYFTGDIDEVRMYDFALSSGQIGEHHNLDYNTLHHAETSLDDQFYCKITPNDGEADGETKQTNTLTIVNAAPSGVSLLKPENNTHFGAPVEFNWTASNDIDNDTIYYHIIIDNNSDFSSPEYSAFVSDTKALPESLPIINNNYYYWKVRATDMYDNSSWTDVRRFRYVWEVLFDVTSGEDGSYRNGIAINCNYVGFDQAGDTINPYGPYEFPNGTQTCIFGDSWGDYFNKTLTFTADQDKNISVIMSKAGKLTLEEHTWLEALYNCIILKDCDLYNLLIQINQTTTNIWEHTRPTDQSVISLENVTNKVVNSTHNLTIDYIVNIPIKSGYGLGDYLPIRIGYWLMDETNTTCYNQGNKPAGVSDPYCQPLIIETNGPMGGSVSFTVKLWPQLPVGDYSIKRMIDIDPENVWINYGQEAISSIRATENIESYRISLEKTGEVMPQIASNQPQQQNSGGGSGGGGGSITKNTYNVFNITNIIIEEKENNQEENREKQEEKSDKAEEEKESLSEKVSLGKITGMIIDDFIDGLNKGSPITGTIVTLLTVIIGFMGYVHVFKKR